MSLSRRRARARWQTAVTLFAVGLTGCFDGNTGESTGNHDRDATHFSEKMRLIDGQLYLLQGDALISYDLTDPLDPLEGPTLDLSAGLTFGIRKMGDWLLSAGADGIDVYESVPETDTLRAIGSVAVGTGRHEFAALADRVYLATRDDTRSPQYASSVLSVFDFSDGTAPFETHAIDMVQPQSLALFGDDLQVCDGNGGLRHFDLDTPDTPVEQAVFSPDLASGHCALFAASDALYRLQREGLDKLRVVGGQFTRVGRYEFSGIAP